MVRMETSLSIECTVLVQHFDYDRLITLAIFEFNIFFSSLKKRCRSKRKWKDSFWPKSEQLPRANWNQPNHLQCRFFFLLILSGYALSRFFFLFIIVIMHYFVFIVYDFHSVLEFDWCNPLLWVEIVRRWIRLLAACNKHQVSLKNQPRSQTVTASNHNSNEIFSIV